MDNISNNIKSNIPAAVPPVPNKSGKSQGFQGSQGSEAVSKPASADIVDVSVDLGGIEKAAPKGHQIPDTNYAVSNNVFSLFKVGDTVVARVRNLETGDVYYVPRIDAYNFTKSEGSGSKIVGASIDRNV